MKYLLSILLPLSLSSTSLAFDTVNNNGHLDIAWHNLLSGDNSLWTMANEEYAELNLPLPHAGATSWVPVGVNDFNRDNLSDIIWHNTLGANPTYQISIWHMRSNSNILSSTVLSVSTGPDYYIAGTGDFNYDGYPDILLRHKTLDATAVWFLVNGAYSFSQSLNYAVGTAWQPVAVGDPNNDGSADIYWRNVLNGDNSVWYMSGMFYHSGATLAPHELSWKLAAVGPFTGVGNADLVWRYTNSGISSGINSIWIMGGESNKTFVRGVYLPPLNDQNWIVAGLGGYFTGKLLHAVSDGINGLTLRWNYQGSTWDINQGVSATNRPSLYRRVYGTETWSVLQTNLLVSYYIDSGLISTQRYEYLLRDHPPLLASVKAPADYMEKRGKVVLVVDNTITNLLAFELEQFRTDLVGDGWSVIRTNVPRHADGSANWPSNTNSIATIKGFITNIYYADLVIDPLKAVILIGHVPVPYSGFAAWDGHDGDDDPPCHFGAWPADGYYADVDGQWTDNVKIDWSFCTYYPRLFNTTNDFKFDQNFAPLANGKEHFELMFSRIDFSKLPAFSTNQLPPGLTAKNEVDLLRQYFAKNHRYRHKQTPVPQGVVIKDRQFWYKGAHLALANIFASSTLRNASGLLFEFNPFYVSTPFTFGVGWGFGLPLWITNQYYEDSFPAMYIDNLTTNKLQDIVTSTFEYPYLITALSASFIGDQDSTNNLLRGILGRDNYGLASFWGNNLAWHPQRMSLGEPIGAAMITDSAPFSPMYPVPYVGQVHRSLLGDLTIRLLPTGPPTNLTGTNNGCNVDLSWTAPGGETGVQYYVYRSYNGMNGPWPRITVRDAVTFTDSCPTNGAKMYQVRTGKLIINGSGSYTNLSQGAFVSVN